VRRGIRWNVTLVHRVAAPEEHRVRHFRAIEMRAPWLAILARIDVEPHHVAIIIHVIAEYGRDVVWTFREDLIMAGRRGKSRLTGGDRRFTDQMFPFVKVSFLFADVNDNLGRAGDALVVPIAMWLWCKSSERPYIGRRNLLAA